ncbi:glycine--tRNA ligase subunit beta [Pseudotabrizicola sediminis]|uniref:Glycine--tRNA ligase beta subunit n=1 Tax=Pseudotabrizicola sediminis TaxID=2486418 RepID=A0ABY2KK50_9RHOB|nr:glycine--tRNA ligase subunit beta [Pseudotabrizicola sediminis]TGD42387.1 glycine--tRNA ligase subunit beta [Pseudotabrizicola sediminis]
MSDLLIELFSEEIPARMQARARDDLKKLMTDGLVEAGLTYAHAGAFSTPRRLTLAVEGLSAESRAVREERKGPNTSAPAQAVEGFLRAAGLTLDQLEKRADKKGEVYFAVIEKPGRKAPEIIAEVLEGVIRNFPWPKSMRWGNGSLRWVRPLHSILCLLSDEGGAEVVPLTVDGIVSGNTTRGHRFLSPSAFSVSGFEDYAAKLKRAHVILDSAEREDAIRAEAQTLAFAAGMELVEDKGLLAEVAGLVEWPVPLMGRIADDFLGLPAEVLQTSMKEHQKFFSVRNPKTGRIEGFVTVANTVTADHGETILKGNQKVLAARLSDAKFFWENDLRVANAGMGEWEEGLKAVTFHNKLGSQADRIARIAALAREIAPMVGADPDLAERAARLAKLDLRSAMVGEFPELQGLMGMYYATAAGEPDAVANAARDHYSPLGPSDAVPIDPVSVAVALADKIDTLTGFWAIDEKPTGSKDPFALRRAALGVLRLVLGNGVRTELIKVLINSHVCLSANVKLIYNDLDKYDSATCREDELAAVESVPRKGALALVLRTDRAFEVFFEHTRSGAYFKDQTDYESEKKAAFDLIDSFFCYAAHTAYLLTGDSVPMWSDDEHAKAEARFLPIFENSSADLLSFLHDRLKVFLKDQGIRHDVIDACLAMPGNDDLTLLVKRATALQATLQTEDGQNLVQGYKRASNILSQAEQKDGVEYSFGADPKFAETDEERALFVALDAAETVIAPAMAKEDFATAMQAMAALRAPIDAFFTATQINTDNAIVRRNRLNLLHRIRTICLSVADLTRLDG